MSKIHVSLGILALFSIAVFASGCYTVVGYPPLETEEGVVEEAAEGQPTRYYEDWYGYSYPYYWDYYDPYYGRWYPYSRSYYWDYPWWYYDHQDYDYYYVPEKKRGDDRDRSSTDLRRSNRGESRRAIKREEDEEDRQPNRIMPSKREGDETRRSVQRQPEPDSRKRSTKRKSKDEED